jgi:hypothetical protein
MKCPHCSHDVVSATLADGQTILLEPGPATYVAVDEHHIYPEDGDRVFRSSALVEHSVLCPGERRAQAASRVDGKKTYDRTHPAKQGA